MNSIEILEQEHEDLKRDLIEFEDIIQDEEINYPNLIHTFKKIHDTWNEHEEKEERVFPIMKKEKIIMPVERMLFEHKDLRKHKEAVIRAINSGNEAEIKKSLKEDGRQIVKKLREHIDFEDEVLYTIALEEFTEKELKEMERVMR